jgi:hypothetical protein
LNNLSWDFKTILNTNLFNKQLHVPVGTKVSIEYDQHSSHIHFKNPKFSIEILIGLLGSGSGLHQKNPSYQVLMERYPDFAHSYASENFMYFDGAGRMTAKFEFPEFDIDEFRRTLHYYNIMKNLIDEDWNFEKVIEKLPSKDLRIMHSKVDDIMGMLNTPSKNRPIKKSKNSSDTI